MKKPIWLSLGVLMVIFLFKWFFAEIYSFVTPFGLLYLYPILMIIISVMLVWSIVFIAKKFGVWGLKAAIPFLIVMAMPIVLIFPFEEARVFTEFVLYTPQREQVVDRIKDGAIMAHSDRSIVLPPYYRHLSCNGEVFVRIRSDDDILVGFWVFQGLSIDSYSMLYYTEAKNPDRLYLSADEETLKIVKLNDEWYYVVAK